MKEQRESWEVGARWPGAGVTGRARVVYQDRLVLQ
jgi:hypothetical protein